MFDINDNFDDTCPNCGRGHIRNFYQDIYKCTRCDYMEHDGREITEEQLEEAMENE